MPNDDYSGSSSTTGRVNVGGSTAGRIETAGDHDWFAVTLNAGTSYTIRQDAASGSTLDSYLELRNSSGTSVASNDDGGGNNNSLINYTPTTSGTYYLDARGYGSTIGNYSVSVAGSGTTTTISGSVTVTDPVVTNIAGNVLTSAPATAASIFRAKGLEGGSHSSMDPTTGSFITGEVRVLADFSKAAYDLQTWETATVGGRAINDHPSLEGRALSDIGTEGWRSFPLQITGLNPTSTFASPTAGMGITPSAGGLTVNNQFTNYSSYASFYTNANAAACVARCGDSVVISFRGTNDNGNGNTNDSSNAVHPDVDEWGKPLDPSAGSMDDHYALFTPLINALDAYVANSTNGISHVYVTGHSLGGAMALKYMSQQQQHTGTLYQAVTFAAPAFTSTGAGWRPHMDNDNRILQIEVAQDPVPMTFNAGGDENRPGTRILFVGEGDTSITSAPNDYDLYRGNENNHSMDYYREITKSVDAYTWSRATNQPSSVSTPNGTPMPGDVEVILGASQSNGTFFVDGNSSVTANNVLVNNYNSNLSYPASDPNIIYYGGFGNDTLNVGAGPSSARQYTLIGGDGVDIFKFSTKTPITTADCTIQDFHSGVDRIQFLSSAFNNVTTVHLVAGTNPQPTSTDATFLYNTNTGVLAFDSNGTGWLGSVNFVTLVGHPTLQAADLSFVTG